MPILARVFSGILSKEYQAFYDDGVRAFFVISNSLDPLSSIRKSSNIACRLPGWWLVVHGGLLRENCCILKKCLVEKIGEEEWKRMKIEEGLSGTKMLQLDLYVR